MYSKAVWLVAGTVYCISWWAYVKNAYLKYFFNDKSDILPDTASENSISSFYTVKDENGRDVVIPTRYDKSVQSTIQQTSELIRLSAEQVKIDAVDQADINARTIALNAIEYATITAEQITLEGLVTANSNFKILADGRMEAVNGKFSGELKSERGTIGGFTIGASSIYTGDNAYGGGGGFYSFSSSKFFLHSSGSESAFLGFSATGKWAGIGLNTLPLSTDNPHGGIYPARSPCA
ncbi:MAG: hypothetical protein ACI37N_08150 [Prevotella sp.]